MTSVNAAYQIRGGTECKGVAGLAKHATTDDHLLTANAVDYSIDGKAYTKAAVADITPTTLAQQAADTTCLYVLTSNAAGTLAQVKGREVLTADLAVGSATLDFPPLPDAVCALGYYKVVTVAVTFINGTTDYDAAGVTTTFVDVVRLPSVP